MPLTRVGEDLKFAVGGVDLAGGRERAHDVNPSPSSEVEHRPIGVVKLDDHDGASGSEKFLAAGDQVRLDPLDVHLDHLGGGECVLRRERVERAHRHADHAVLLRGRPRFREAAPRRLGGDEELGLAVRVRHRATW